MKTTTHIIEKI